MALRLLIVDDEWLDREGLREQLLSLEMHFAAIHTAKSGAEALRLMELETIDILLTDIRMPQMNGLALAEQAQCLQPALQILFVSGYDDFAYAHRAIKMQAVWYLLKPVQDDELRQALERCQERLTKARPPESEHCENIPALVLSHEEKLCARVDSYIAAHLPEPITLISIAREMHYTPNHLGKVFQETRGVGFSAHLQKMRMSSAERLLREEPALRIREVARMVGYTNAEAFSRAFFQEYGVSPLAFRNAVKA